MSSLVCTSLCAGYSKNIVIKDLSFEVSAGEILALIGPNGAGKSTLLKTISGELPIMDGGIMLEGRDIRSFSDIERARHISIMRTSVNRTGLISCREVVELGRYPYTGRLGYLRPQDREIVRECLYLTDTMTLADRDFSTLSDGQRQRVMLARALCQEPSVMLLDEPTAFLDIRYKLEFLSLLKRLSSEKKFAVLLSIHELELARQVADGVIAIKDGRQFGSSKTDAFEEDNLRKLFDIEDETWHIS